MNFTVDLNTILVLTGLVLNVYLVIGRTRILEHRLTKLEEWKRIVSEHFLTAKKV